MTLWSRAPKLAHDVVVTVGDAAVRLKINARARRVSLRVDAARGEIVAIAPDARRLSDAVRFATSRSDWIALQLQNLPQVVTLRPGAVIQVDGAPCRLERAAMRVKARYVPRTTEEIGRLIASGDGEAYGRAVVRALKALALDRLVEQSARHVAALSQPLPEIVVMDARMRWGSCQKAQRDRPGRIRYNWRLILAPPWVLNYVAAHEVAHLVEANHSPAYWAVVQRIFGDHRPARAWLRAHGAALYAVGA